MHFAAFFIYGHKHAAEKRWIIRLGKTNGTLEALLFNGKLALYTQHGKLCAAHSRIGDVSCVVIKYYLVGGLHMGMCAYDGGHFACQIEAHGFLFLGGFRMEIHKDIGGVDILKEPVYTLEGIVQRLHERCAHKVYDCKAVRTHIKHAYAVQRQEEGES